MSDRVKMVIKGLWENVIPITLYNLFNPVAYGNRKVFAEEIRRIITFIDRFCVKHDSYSNKKLAALFNLMRCYLHYALRTTHYALKTTSDNTASYTFPIATENTPSSAGVRSFCW